MNQKTDNATDDDHPWINPIGGLGDQLMLAGVLKLVNEHDPNQKFNLVKRARYLPFLKKHPAIAKVGFPPKNARLMGVDYWSMQPLGPDENRPFQILARAYGLKTPVEENLYIPEEPQNDELLHQFIPWKDLNVIIAPSSDSPRKAMDPNIWHQLVERLNLDDFLVMQAGRLKDQHIRNTYSLLGLTSPHQIIALMKKADLIITADNFIMHAAHLVQKPAVVLWGATSHKVYGYPGHTHIQGPKGCDLDEFEDCIGPTRNKGGILYGTPCPQKEKHCLDQITPDMIYQAVNKALG